VTYLVIDLFGVFTIFLLALTLSSLAWGRGKEELAHVCVGSTGKLIFITKIVNLTFGKGLESGCLHTFFWYSVGER